MLPPLEPRKPNAPPGTLTGLQTPVIPSSGASCLAEIDDGVLRGILGQLPAPGSNDALDCIPPGAEGSLREPFSHLEAGPEFSKRPVVGKARIASVLAKEDFLLRRGLERHSVAFQQGCLPTCSLEPEASQSWTGKCSAGDNTSGMRQQKVSGVSTFYEVLTDS